MRYRLTLILSLIMLIFLGGLNTLKAQDSLSVQPSTFLKISYGFGVERLESPFQMIHPIDTLMDVNRRVGTGINNSLSVGLFRRLNNYLNLGLSLRYDQSFNNYQPQRTKNQMGPDGIIWTTPYGNHMYQKYYLSVHSEIDLLWKSPQYGLLLTLGGAGSYYERTDVYEVRERGTSDIYASIEYLRSGVFYQSFVGLEWEHQLNAHWAYRIGIMGSPNYFFRPQKVDISRDYFNGQSFPDQTITRDDFVFNQRYNENLAHRSMQVQFSCIYYL